MPACRSGGLEGSGRWQMAAAGRARWRMRSRCAAGRGSRSPVPPRARSGQDAGQRVDAADHMSTPKEPRRVGLRRTSRTRPAPPRREGRGAARRQRPLRQHDRHHPESLPAGTVHYEPAALPGRRVEELAPRGGSAETSIENVGVIGCGLMGSGIVQVTAQAGFDASSWRPATSCSSAASAGCGRRWRGSCRRAGSRPRPRTPRWRGSPAPRGSRTSRGAISWSRP